MPELGAAVPTPTATDWWRDAVLYHVYVRSFADSDGDGVGDLDGVRAHLDHLVWLGVDAVWLSPVNLSPDADWGYDVSDYRSIQPVLGGDAALDRLLDAAHAVGLRVLLDLVPNHTSVEHRWFREALASHDDPRRRWYHFADSRNGGPPNNWVSDFSGPAWRREPGGDQWYLASFLPEQADLDWNNDDVRTEFLDLLRSWFDRGVDGVRIDVAHKLVKDAQLRDDPPLRDDDDVVSRQRGQSQLYNAERPELHDIYRSWRRLGNDFDPPRLFLGETYLGDVRRLRPFFGDDDELQLCLNVPFMVTPFDAASVRRVIAETAAALPDHAWPLWCGSSHDISRLATRWCAGNQGLVRCALVLLLTLRGAPLLYYGDEIGMDDVRIGPGQVRDRVAAVGEPRLGRDPQRSPMQWSAEPGAGFTTPDAEPWLPIGDAPTRNVAAQRRERGSILHLCRDLIALRHQDASLRRGSMRLLDTADDVLALERGERTLVVVNLGEEPATLEDVRGMLTIASDRERDGERIDGALRLAGHSAAVVALG